MALMSHKRWLFNESAHVFVCPYRTTSYRCFDGPCSVARSGGVPRSEPDVPEKVGKELRAFRIVDRPPAIDGRLDEAVWGAADAIGDLVQNEPDNMEPETERTVIRVAYDDRYLYVAAHCYMSVGAQVSSGLGRRDSPPPSDQILLSFDPSHDHLTGYTFQVNPSGVQSDFTWFDDIRSNVTTTESGK